jgi:hypothetical protein
MRLCHHLSSADTDCRRAEQLVLDTIDGPATRLTQAAPDALFVQHNRRKKAAAFNRRSRVINLSSDA